MGLEKGCWLAPSPWLGWTPKCGTLRRVGSALGKALNPNPNPHNHPAANNQHMEEECLQTADPRSVQPRQTAQTSKCLGLKDLWGPTPQWSVGLGSGLG